MKTIYTLILTFLYFSFCFNISAQEENETERKQLPTFNIFNNADFTITGISDGYFKVNFTMINKTVQDSIAKFTLQQMNLESFDHNFKKGLLTTEMLTSTSADSVSAETKQLFYSFVASLQTIEMITDEGPIAGTIFLKSDKLVKIKKGSNKQNHKNNAKVLLKSKKVDLTSSKKTLYEVGSNWYSKKDAIRQIIITEEERKSRESYEAFVETQISLKQECEEIASKRSDKISLSDSLKKQTRRIGILTDSIKAVDNHISIYKNKRDELNKTELPANFFSSIIDVCKNCNSGEIDPISLKNTVVIDSFQLEYKKQLIVLLDIDYSLVIDSLSRSLNRIKADTLLLTNVIDSIQKLSIDTLIISDNYRISRRDSIQNLENRLDNLRVNINTINTNIKTNSLAADAASNSMMRTFLTRKKNNFEALKENIEENKNRTTNKVRDLETSISTSIQEIDKLKTTYFSNYKSLTTIDFTIESADIEIKDGFIENIKVKGTTKTIGEVCSGYTFESKLTFENLYPIGFSREVDYDHFHNTNLSAYDAEGNAYSLRLSDVLSYDIEHRVNRRDYSPANQSFGLNNGDTKSKQLRKLETFKLFELKVYSDFVGFDETAPNGLIQTELENEIPINTRRYKTIQVWRANHGFLGYVVPNLVISKIENKNKYLPVSYRDDFTNGVYTPEKFASTLDLYKYESFSTGLDFNAIIFDVINAKSTITFDLGFRFGTTPMVDSVRTYDGTEIKMTNEANEYNVTTYRVYPKITLAIHPEERYSIKLAYIWNYYWARTNTITQVGNAEQFALDGLSQDKVNRFNTIELSAGINVNKSSSGKLFFRYRYNWQQNYWNTGFNQAQVGYSFYLLGRYKK